MRNCTASIHNSAVKSNMNISVSNSSRIIRIFDLFNNSLINDQ